MVHRADLAGRDEFKPKAFRKVIVQARAVAAPLLSYARGGFDVAAISCFQKSRRQSIGFMQRGELSGRY